MIDCDCFGCGFTGLGCWGAVAAEEGAFSGGLATAEGGAEEGDGPVAAFAFAKTGFSPLEIGLALLFVAAGALDIRFREVEETRQDLWHHRGGKRRGRTCGITGEGRDAAGPVGSQGGGEKRQDLWYYRGGKRRGRTCGITGEGRDAAGPVASQGREETRQDLWHHRGGKRCGRTCGITGEGRDVAGPVASQGREETRQDLWHHRGGKRCGRTCGITGEGRDAAGPVASQGREETQQDLWHHRRGKVMHRGGACGRVKGEEVFQVNIKLPILFDIRSSHRDALDKSVQRQFWSHVNSQVAEKGAASAGAGGRGLGRGNEISRDRSPSPSGKKGSSGPFVADFVSNLEEARIGTADPKKIAQVLNAGVEIVGDIEGSTRAAAGELDCDMSLPENPEDAFSGRLSLLISSLQTKEGGAGRSPRGRQDGQKRDGEGEESDNDDSDWDGDDGDYSGDYTAGRGAGLFVSFLGSKGGLSEAVGTSRKKREVKVKVEEWGSLPQPSGSDDGEDEVSTKRGMP
uniref:Uncharacterized protein n=1 Tax=Chromera velia CCMP2878 TaxID=1169474 RepID=A0A0K6SAN2_9ALVE|eukprot:Cvel_1823.t2-p1 / transcript=Cvel_1823.t2 / gene=Cvel_1823 / organism=Chromera_velia_CCMP2878 / gene_product=hypothetical protein / transcript_product=hypothetical protein / location=Cvel_scaffold67:73436-78163(-) / protein_length=515 / sequence_SO=supercontig / SO=protein_coding / is_pseudo=false